MAKKKSSAPKPILCPQICDSVVRVYKGVPQMGGQTLTTPWVWGRGSGNDAALGRDAGVCDLKQVDFTFRCL